MTFTINIPAPTISREDRVGGKFRVTVPRAANADIQLTEDQEKALKALLEFEASDERFFLLSGYAGTGKTTVLQFYLRESSKRQVLTAPTNKAVRVLREMAEAHGLSVECGTIHRLLSLKLSNDAEEKYCVQRDRMRGDLPTFDVLVIDECSMVGSHNPMEGRALGARGLYEQITEYAERHDLKVVFVGDPGQLPPVKEGELSLTFNTKNGAFLHHVVRQALDSPIIRLATYIRERMYGGTPKEPELADDGFDGVYVTHGRSEFEDLVVEAYLDEAQSPTKYKALAWRNRTVDALNVRIRRELFGDACRGYIIGERYVTTQPVVEFQKDEWGKWQTVIHAPTDEDAVLLDMEERKHPQWPQYRTLKLRLEGVDGPYPAWVVHPEQQARWEADLERLRNLAKDKRDRRITWQDFWRLHDGFAHLRPHYVMTVHRSQGSTYENVFVDVPDVLANRTTWEAMRCLYVACTRASRMLYLLE